jgi:uncharacterized protein (DUF2147 family)
VVHVVALFRRCRRSPYEAALGAAMLRPIFAIVLPHMPPRAVLVAAPDDRGLVTQMDLFGPESFRVSGWDWLVGALTSMLMLMPTAASAGPALSVFGVWQHPENGSRIEVYPCQTGRLCVRIVAIGDGQQNDDKNPEPKLRSRPIIGLMIMSGAERTADGSWSGRLYNRNDGQFYDGIVAPAGTDKLKLTGCAVVVLCRTLIWHRVPKPAPS